MPTPRVCRWRWAAPCARRICRWAAPPRAVSPAAARPPAAGASAWRPSMARACVPWWRPALRRRGALDESDDVKPAGNLVRALLACRDGGGIAPHRGGLLGPVHEVVEDIRGGLGLDQAAQAEA